MIPNKNEPKSIPTKYKELKIFPIILWSQIKWNVSAQVILNENDAYFCQLNQNETADWSLISMFCTKCGFSFHAAAAVYEEFRNF